MPYASYLYATKKAGLDLTGISRGIQIDGTANLANGGVYTRTEMTLQGNVEGNGGLNN